MQSIYNDGIGDVKKYIDDHTIEEIIKNDNFRCSKEVIDLLNSIRKDLKQELALTKEQNESDRIGSVTIYYKLIDFVPKDNKEYYFSLIDECIDLIDVEKKSKIQSWIILKLAMCLKRHIMTSCYSWHTISRTFYCRKQSSIKQKIWIRFISELMQMRRRLI